MTRHERAQRLLELLPKLYPTAHCELAFRDPLQLLVATILSAQCTDERVNQVTPALFLRCPTAADYAEIPQSELESLIRPTGFFRNKAKNIRAMARCLLEKHQGRVPSSLTELAALPGVGRKTANVVLGNAFSLNEGVVVDTHIGRLSRRLGLSRHSQPGKVEQDLARLFPRECWTDLSHWLIAHGRRICSARRPQCAICPFSDFCPSAPKLLAAAQKSPPRKTTRHQAAQKSASANGRTRSSPSAQGQDSPPAKKRAKASPSTSTTR